MFCTINRSGEGFEAANDHLHLSLDGFLVHFFLLSWCAFSLGAQQACFALCHGKVSKLRMIIFVFSLMGCHLCAPVFCILGIMLPSLGVQPMELCLTLPCRIYGVVLDTAL